MPQIINTNVASLNAQRNLNRSQSQLGVALERLSSGLRINSAKDDAAGLAISDRFTTQIRGLNQAARNASDGISLSQTAESALGELTVNLQRIRELAVQSANSTNSSSDRAALNQEVTQRLAEIDRISSQTSFNGQKILDGTFGEAQFQIGANAGEVIKIDLTESLRQNAIGAIASTTSQSLGASATGGSIDIASTQLDFGTAAVTDTAGSLTVNAGTRLFGTDATTGIEGRSDINTFIQKDFSVAAVTATAKTTTTDAFTAGDYTLSGADAHFTLTDDSGSFNIVLDGTNYTGNDAGLVAEINTQLGLAGSNTLVSQPGGVGTSLIFTSGETGSAATQPALSGVGAALVGDGLANPVNAGGVDTVVATDGVVTVDGTGVALVADHSSDTVANDFISFTAELQAAIDASALGANNYTVVTTGNQTAEELAANGALGATQYFIRHENTTAAVTIASDIDAQNAGVTNGTTGAVGTAAVATTNAVFNIDGYAITLDTDYATFDALAADLDVKLEAANPGTDVDNGDGTFGQYTVSNDNGTLTFTRNNLADDSAITIDAAAPNTPDANAVAAGFGANAGLAGVPEGATTNAQFKVDGTIVNLDQDYSAGGGTNDLDEVAAAIQAQLSGYTVTANAGDDTISIVNDTNGSAAVVISDVEAGDAGYDAQKVTNAGTAGYLSSLVGTAGVSAGTISVNSGDLSIQVGDLAAVEVAGTFSSVDELATYINSNVSGVFASEDTGGKLKLQSDREITLSGSQATSGTFSFASADVAVDTGSLATATVATVSGSNDTIVAVDSALTRVSSLRSNFGAIQSRFESTIANLTTTSENLSAARSRILDADFAQETAALTRAQILQQAGVSILSQANSLPQLALSLLQ